MNGISIELNLLSSRVDREENLVQIMQFIKIIQDFKRISLRISRFFYKYATPNLIYIPTLIKKGIKKAAQKGVTKKGVSKNGASKKGTQKGATKKGVYG